MAALEDAGFYCVDNMPVDLLPKFLELPMERDSEIVGIALVMDLRENTSLSLLILNRKATISKYFFWKQKKKSWFSATAQLDGNTRYRREKACLRVSGLKKSN